MRRTNPGGLRAAENAIMTSDIKIRNETSDDIAAIDEVTTAAFRDLQISNQTEHFIINALRTAEALALSLVAVVDGRVVGHIAFSPVTLSDGTVDWYGLGPVSVLPQVQRRGIGQALVREGLSQLKRMQARGCCLVGHPEYYRRFGFENCPQLVLEGVPPEVFFAVSFDGTMPRGTVAFHKAFAAVDPSSCANDV
jgi:putative acetyltransferase